MKPKLYQEVAITCDFPDENLKAGDVAVLIDYVRHPRGGEEGAILEVLHAVGETIGVATVPASAIAPLRADPTRAQLIAEMEALRVAGVFEHVTSLRNQYPAPALGNVSDEQLRAAIHETANVWEGETPPVVHVGPAADLDRWTGLIAVGGDALEDSKRVFGK